MIPSTPIPLNVKLADWTPIRTPLMVELIAPKERASGIPASASFAKSLLEYEIIVFWQKGTQSRPRR
jgi:hypothetical protein